MNTISMTTKSHVLFHNNNKALYDMYATYVISVLSCVIVNTRARA